MVSTVKSHLSLVTHAPLLKFLFLSLHLEALFCLALCSFSSKLFPPSEKTPVEVVFKSNRG